MVIHIGSRGTRVRALQIRLSDLGYGPLSRDGLFGPATERAVRQFQAAHGLKVDGVVGPMSWAALADPPVGEAPTPATATEDTAANRALAFALADLGLREMPDGSNAGPAIAHLVDGYAEHWRIAGSPRYPWCAMAVGVWTARALGLGDRGDAIDWKQHPFRAWLGGAAQIEDWAKAEGRWERKVTAAPPGAIYTMARDGSGSDAAAATRAGHTGLVVAVSAAGVQTIDGNVSNRVSSRTRAAKDIRGWVRWW